MGRLRAIITDFDGTLVNTLTANSLAYSDAFDNFGIKLNENEYKERYGLRYDDLCKSLGIIDDNIKKGVKELKAKLYPQYFYCIKVNEELLKFIIFCKRQGIKTCIASTASKVNLYGVLNYFHLTDYFDIIISGEDVNHGKPNPEVYLKALNVLECEPDEVLVFEDSEVGCEAAENAEINYIKIKEF